MPWSSESLCEKTFFPRLCVPHNNVAPACPRCDPSHPWTQQDTAHHPLPMLPLVCRHPYRERATEATLSCTRPRSFQCHGTRTRAIQCHDVRACAEQDLLITLLAKSFNVLLLAPVTPRQQGQTVIQRRLLTTVNSFSPGVYAKAVFRPYSNAPRSRRL